MSQDDSDNSLIKWYESLTGRRSGGDGDRAALALRQSLLAEEQEASAENLEQEWHRLRFRLRREGLLEEDAPRRPWLTWAMAASVVLAGGLGLLLTREAPPTARDESDVMRGAPAQAVVLRVPDPAAAAEQLVRACREAGVDCKRRQDATGVPLLDVPAPIPHTLSHTIKEYGADLPPDRPVTLVLMRRP
jgi:hypothetical protein